MSKSEFIKYIKSMKEDELREEMKQLYSRFKDIRKHYTMELGNEKDRAKVYERARKEITNYYLIRGLHRKRPKVRKLNSLFSDLKKNSVFPHELIGIYLHSVRHAIIFIRDTRRSQDPVNNHLFNSFDAAIELIDENMLQENFKAEVNDLISLSKPLYFTHKKLLEINSS